MKKALLSVTAFLCALALVFCGAFAAVTATMPPYLDSAGNVNHTEKMTGIYLMEQSTAQDDNLIIFGSSELRTTEISTHPANFFADKRAGFQVNLVGRGSCQSLIHAMAIAASCDALRGKKVVLITSPQSFVPEGIAPDLFAANFSPQQYLELLAANDLSDETKRAISVRVGALLDAYETSLPDTAIRVLANHTAEPTVLSTVRNAVLSPYYLFSRYLYDLKDKTSARTLLKSLPPDAPTAQLVPIDWAEEEQAALANALSMTDNNDFGMLNDYYTTYIGSRLVRQKDKDATLDYASSKEYDDLRILFEVCRQKGIEPLFVHVPLHGAWSDYTGFPSGRRAQYYDNVRAITAEYGVQTLDLTTCEYDEYFLCDVMHLGWKGWLEVDQALVDYYYGS